MTIDQAWERVKQHESHNDLHCIGDDGRAGGAAQMWWVFREDYWPAWCWMVLEAMDRIAFANCLRRHPGKSLRGFYETIYNPHSSAPDLPDEIVEL